MARAITTTLLGEDLALAHLPPGQLTGIGLSDEELYARYLRRAFAYRNTFYHQEPMLDIANVAPDLHATADFVVASDVLEHVVPPVERAFAGLSDLLKPGGAAIVTVPFTQAPDTLEHFPELHDYRIDFEAGRWTLYNRCADGREQVFRELVFHGGPGRTLEMRVFSEAHLFRLFREAGFERVEKISGRPAEVDAPAQADVVFVAHKPCHA